MMNHQTKDILNLEPTKQYFIKAESTNFMLTKLLTRLPPEQSENKQYASR